METNFVIIRFGSIYVKKYNPVQKVEYWKTVPCIDQIYDKGTDKLFRINDTAFLECSRRILGLQYARICY